MANETKNVPTDENEGEGSRTAARRYDAGVEETVRRGHVRQDADQAAREVDARPEDYRQAEEAGKQRSAGEAPGDVAGSGSGDVE